MTYKNQIASNGLDAHYASLFEALPGSCVLLKNDAPHYTILAATPEYFVQTGTTREGIIGKGVFEAFPGNSNDATDTGTKALIASLEQVIVQKKVHHLPLQRYDVAGDNGSFSEKYWRISNKPVLTNNGEVVYIVNSAEDITKEVMAVETDKKIKSLEESEQDLHSLVLQAPIGICVIEADTLVSKMANESFAEIAGRPIDEIIGWMHWDTFAEARPYYEEALNRVVREGITFRAHEVEVPLLRHGKKENLNVTFVYEPVKDRNGITKKVAVWVVDNTPQIHSRKLLQESEQYFRQLTDTVPAIIWITDRDGSCSYLNQHWFNYTGQDAKEAKGFGWLNATHPDDKEAAGKIFLEANKTQKPFTLLYRLRFKSGEYRWCKDSGSPVFGQDGEFEGFIGTVIDVHEEKAAEEKLRESEERFRSMADASPVMIWTLDEAGNSTYYNSRAAEFTGHNEEELRDGKSWQVAIHPDDIEFAGGVVGNAVVNRIPYKMECRMQRADGEWRWLLNHGTPRFGKAGDYFGFVGSSIDITEHKRSQQELQTALEQIRLSKEAAELGTFDMDLEKGTMHWDDRCRTLFGISHHNIVTYEQDFVKGLHPDDRERIIAVINQLFDKSISNGDYDVEYRTVGAEDNIMRWVRAKGKVYFTEQGTPVRFIGSVLDITEKVMAMQRIEALVEERTKELAQANEALQKINKELQRSNQNLEEFAHAASHDLKEPVRKIHFYTNQLKDQLSTQLQESQARALNRIENASQRMANLIDDLLLYSHVSQRPHETESVDLNQKMKNVLEDLELDITEKSALIKIEKLPVVKGYRRQLQQLFQNLISNALKYSKADAPPSIHITAKSFIESGKPYHLIEVKDNGIGFQREYADKIFQMFTRLHGKTEYSGTGVGLSIVKKVVENHEGIIKVESTPGEGSTFSVLLPV